MKLHLIGFVSLVPALVLAGCGGATATYDPEGGGEAASGGDSGTSTEGGGTSTSLVTGVGSSVNRGGSTSKGGSPGKGGSAAVGGSYATGGSPVTSWGSSSGFCTYGKVLYPVGSTFPSSDGCNSCYCGNVDGVSCTAMACWNGCEFEGNYLQSGESIQSSDGCNTCTCSYDATTGASALGCTQMACVGSCRYAGRMYANGDGFLATDGCNKCSCSNGSISCSDMACVCNPSTEYWRIYEAYSATDCAKLDYACPSRGSAPFANACGCGCEESPDCPPSFSCITDTLVSPAGGAGGASNADIAELPLPPSGGSGSGVSYDPAIECVSAAERAACPLSPMAVVY